MQAVAQEKHDNIAHVDFTLEQLDEYMNKPDTSLRWAKRMDYSQIEDYKDVCDIIISQGIPVVLSNTTKDWPKDMFTLDFLNDHCGKVEMENSPRDNHTLLDMTGWTVGQYISYLQQPGKRTPERLYGKDMPCPDEWKDLIASRVHPFFVYRGDYDLLEDLPQEELKPLNLMIYVGFGGTFTPGHKDICGSLGHNVMVQADTGATAIWFCVATKHVEEAHNYWQIHDAMLSHDNYFMSLQSLSKAPFPVYVIKQGVGDFVLVPPETAHQVVNKGGNNIKVAWNTITTKSIGLSFRKVLPMLQSVQKAEIYRIKTVAFYSLRKRIQLVEAAEEKGRFEDLRLDDFPPLLSVVRDSIFEDKVENEGALEPRLLKDEIKHMRICNFCNCDIWNRCYHCMRCKEDLDYCLECVANGRGCSEHGIALELTEFMIIDDCIALLNRGYEAYEKLLQYHKIPDAAKIVDEIRTSLPSGLGAGEIALRRIQAYLKGGDLHCHQCKLRKPTHICITCRNLTPVEHQEGRRIFCESCLWNRYNIKMLACARNLSWKCPICEEMCNCAACQRKYPDWKPKPTTSKEMSLEAIGRGSMGGLSDKKPRGRVPKPSSSILAAEGAFGTKTEAWRGSLVLVYREWVCKENKKPYSKEVLRKELRERSKWDPNVQEKFTQAVIESQTAPFSPTQGTPAIMSPTTGHKRKRSANKYLDK